ncbi:MAG TPA: UDP binding domain-containing protein, partial [Anaerolineae bacterium]
IELLLKAGARVDYYDPYVPVFHVGNNVFQPEPVALESTGLDAKTLSSADAVVIVTAHRNVDYAFVVEHARVLVDTANATKGLDQTKVTRLGAPN